MTTYEAGDPTNAAQVASRGLILLTEVGSRAHGLQVDDQDDRDLLGICVEPPTHVIGLRSFEHYVRRTQPEGARSGPGDVDLTVYSLRRWLRLALAGNPSILTSLFVADGSVVTSTEHGRHLRAHPELVLSRRAGHRFAGYLRSQRAGLLELRSPRGAKRPELVERYGFDTKFAYHMVRLGVQGLELLDTGRVTLPTPEPWRSWLLELRRGEHTRDDALVAADTLERRLLDLLPRSPLPDHPDVDRAGDWAVGVYLDVWQRGLPREPSDVSRLGALFEESTYVSRPPRRGFPQLA